jgi:hypothetical protein
MNQKLAAYGALAVGALFGWSGITGKSITQVIQATVSGQNPALLGQANPVRGGNPTGTVTSPAGGSIILPGGDEGNRGLARMMAAQRGWTGDKWTALDELWSRESQFSSTVVNPDSGAAGIAQKITGFDSSYQKGNAQQQIAWGLDYIEGRYGDPVHAWQHEQQFGWY